MFYWPWFNRPRHSPLRFVFGAAGAALLTGVLAFALIAFAFIGGIVAIVRMLTRPRPAATRHGPSVIEGEFVVLPNNAAPVKH